MTNIEKIIESLVFIEWNMKENIDINSISAEVGYSPRYFSRLFKKVTGFTVNNYLQRRRLTEAVKSANKQPDNIITIAKDYQFKEMGSFTHKLYNNFNMQLHDIRRKENLKKSFLQEPIIFEMINKTGLKPA